MLARQEKQAAPHHGTRMAARDIIWSTPAPETAFGIAAADPAADPGAIAVPGRSPLLAHAHGPVLAAQENGKGGGGVPTLTDAQLAHLLARNGKNAPGAPHRKTVAAAPTAAWKNGFRAASGGVTGMSAGNALVHRVPHGRGLASYAQAPVSRVPRRLSDLSAPLLTAQADASGKKKAPSPAVTGKTAGEMPSPALRGQIAARMMEALDKYAAMSRAQDAAYGDGLASAQ